LGSHILIEPIEKTAENDLKEMDISARVSTEAQTDLPVIVTEAVSAADGRNFETRTHCEYNRKPNKIIRVGRNTPLISRTDGKNYHLFLFHGPTPVPATTKGSLPGDFLVNFRYALDSQKMANKPVMAFMHNSPDEPLQQARVRIEAFADRLEKILKDGKRPESIYRE
jgi:hypothetical protein